MVNENLDEDVVWFVYDGDCPLCVMGATHFRIKQAVGKLVVLNAREAGVDHHIMREINANRLDLDKGMVLKIGGRLYHGADALNVMAMIGGDTGWFNKFNARLFKSRRMSQICYPLIKMTRDVLLYVRGFKKIKNLEAIR